jgi:hypothetical protein
MLAVVALLLLRQDVSVKSSCLYVIPLADRSAGLTPFGMVYRNFYLVIVSLIEENNHRRNQSVLEISQEVTFERALSGLQSSISVKSKEGKHSIIPFRPKGETFFAGVNASQIASLRRHVAPHHL